MWLNIPRDAELYLLVVLWVLVPLVPAVLICWIFPKTEFFTNGPVAGLTVRAGGAAGLYLIILLVSIPLTDKIYDDIHGNERAYWTVHGDAQFLDSHNNIVNDESFLKKISLSTRPDHFIRDTFSLEIPVTEEIGGRFPRLIVGVDDDWKVSIDLNKEREKKSLKLDDRSNKEIELGSPILIKQRLTSSGSLSGMDYGSKKQ